MYQCAVLRKGHNYSSHEGEFGKKESSLVDYLSCWRQQSGLFESGVKKLQIYYPSFHLFDDTVYYLKWLNEPS